MRIKACYDCAFEIDVYSRVECTDHIWHVDWNKDVPENEVPLVQFNLLDMCCRCGKDLEMVGK